ncbi:MAG: pyridoxamine 5'-phosphate oxidase [Gammaproteobacteria bacterium]|nr:MAG: pyridoxamine 5'-phosphate oxidase [Gammaproteobacteria bacterium]
MAKQFPALDDKHIQFIEQQKLFFVATAADQGYVNVSPKGLDSLRIINKHTVAWLNLTGSGNESAAHILQNPRMTLMFCSFDKQPLILRLYGTATAIHPKDSDWPQYDGLFPDYRGARQIFLLSIELVQTSCGFAVPY